LIRTTPIFDTATETVTDLVNIKREGNLGREYSILQYTAGCYTPFLGPVWCIQSIVLTVTGGLAVTRWCF